MMPPATLRAPHGRPDIMTDVHLPQLDDADEAPAPPAAAGEKPAAASVPVPHRSHGRSLGRILLEVVLISVGVFLGLAGEQLRESMHDRELAQASLHRFRSEFRTNREGLAAVAQKHATKLKDMQAYFDAHRAELRAHIADRKVPLPLPVPDTATDPAFFEYSAWDLAMATQSLAHMDPELAFAISHVYRVQQQIDEGTRAITQAMYSFSDELAFLYGVTTYYGDCTLLEPRLLKIYDEILPRLDRALGDSH
jgi:hypothetical protein